MFERKTKKVDFQDGELEIGGMPVYRAMILREKFKAIKVKLEGADSVEDTEAVDITQLKIEVIKECVVSPEISEDTFKNMDLETLEDLFDVVCKNNGMIPQGN